MKNTHSLALAAAIAGLLGGTTARLSAQPTQQNGATSASAGVLLAQTTPAPAKHSCKGKGACATDGSTPPKA